MAHPRVLFLPGASGAGSFWHPVARHLPAARDTVCFDWPGLGRIPADPRVKALDDLVSLVLAKMRAPVDLVAQSMGGVVAVEVAIQRPDLEEGAGDAGPASPPRHARAFTNSSD